MGGLAGATVGLLGSLLPGEARIALGTGLAMLLVVVPMVSARLPQVNRETKQSLLGRGPYVWALSNGALLGLGFTSRIGYWTFYLVPLCCLAVGSPPIGAIIWGAYGLTRMFLASVIACLMHRAPEKMGTWSARLLALGLTARRASRSVTVLAALGLTLWLGL